MKIFIEDKIIRHLGEEFLEDKSWHKLFMLLDELFLLKVVKRADPHLVDKVPILQFTRQNANGDIIRQRPLHVSQLAIGTPLA